MYEIGTSKPFGGYQIGSDSYVYRSPFGQIALYIDVRATIVQSTWHTIAFVPDGSRPSQFIKLDAHIMQDDGTLIPIQCFVYSNGDVMVWTDKPNGQYRFHVTGSYFIL